ncbi:MAG: hypothetical protein WEE64_14705 [Dehalococcoidia bacterium]
MRPVVNGLKQEYAGQLTFVTLDYDTDEDLRIANKLNAGYHPAVVYMHADGSVERTVIGYQSEDVLRENIESLLTR